MMAQHPSTEEWLSHSEDYGEPPAEGYSVASAGQNGVAAGDWETAPQRVGINWGAAFFGWVVMVGLAVLLTALSAAGWAAFTVSRGQPLSDAFENASGGPRWLGPVAAAAGCAMVLLAYFCGGYVASRMSRFDGVRQGLGVWVWSLVALVGASLASGATTRSDLLAGVDRLPRVPLAGLDPEIAALVGAVALLALSLLGALLGGRAGMRYHRRLEAASAEPYP